MRVTQPLSRCLQQHPDKTAVICEGRVLSWRDFHDRVARLAGGLRGLGLERGDRVAIVALNSDRYLETFFATPWAGGVIVPVNVRWSAPEIAFALNDSGTRICFLDDTFRKLADELVPLLDHDVDFVFSGSGTPAGFRASHDVLIDEHPILPDQAAATDDLSGIFYTGGTTGRSKGVMLSHGNHTTNSLQMLAATPIPPECRYLHAAPMFHIADGLFVYMVTLLGGTHVVIPRFEPAVCAAALQAHRITDVILVPTMIQMLLDLPNLAEHDLSHLERMFYGASPMPETTVLRLLETLPQCQPIQLYGQTECAPTLTYMTGRYHTTSGPDAGKLRAAGRALPCVELKIADDDGTEVARGEVGEIWARGPQVMQGYWQLPEQTAATLKDGWLRTGDAARMDEDGFIFITDRLKDMIISGGENVYSSEVENAIYGHPDVAQCAVIGVPDDKWGERVHAIVVLKPDASATEQDITAHCRTLIADFKCPRSVAFRTEALPLSGAGKVLKTELRKPYWERSGKGVN